MGSFKLGGMTLGSLFKKPETTLYPLETRPQYPGLKGHVVLDPAACILCGICVKTCPAHALEVDKKERVWTVDPYRCVQCSMCVRGCPKGCLTMEPAAPVTTTAPSRTVVAVPEKAKPKKSEDASA